MIAFVGACSEDEPTTPTEVDYSIPLAIGNWWKYEVYEVNDDGEIVGTLLNTFTITVEKRDSLEGRYAYYLKTEGRKKGGYSTCIDVDKDGIYFYEPWLDWGVSDKAPKINSWPMNIDYKNMNWEMYNSDQNYKDRGIESSGYIKKIGQNTGTEIIEYKELEYSVMNILNIFDKNVVNNLISATDTIAIIEKNTDTTEFQIINGIGIYSYTRMDVPENERHFRRKEILVDHGPK